MFKNVQLDEEDCFGWDIKYCTLVDRGIPEE